MKELMCPKEMPSETMTVERCVSPVSDEQRKEDAKERRKRYDRERYLKNKERINAQNKEYYHANREHLCVQMREYQKANKEHLCAQKREYCAANRERMRAWRQEYYAANRERLCAKMREYGAANRERLSAKNREYREANKERLKAQKQEYLAANKERVRAWKQEYYAANRERMLVCMRDYQIKNKDELALQRKKRYENNKYMLCYNLLNRYLFKSIEQARCLYMEKINHYMRSYPFEEYAERYIKGELYRNRIYPSQDHYADCYDAGMLAYLYSIHRCAAMDYTYVVAYIKKLVKICIICALVVYREAKNLCKVNGFRQIQLDAAEPGRGY